MIAVLKPVGEPAEGVEEEEGGGGWGGGGGGSIKGQRWRRSNDSGALKDELLKKRKIE